MTFPVELSNPSTGTITVDWATSSLTGDTAATAGTDYTTASGTLTFEPGEFRKEIAVTLKSDTEVEEDERFYVTLTNPVHADCITFAGQELCTASGTIQDSSPDPELVLQGPETVLQENAGNAVFTISLLHPDTGDATHSNSTINVDYATSDGGDDDDKDATVNEDYTEAKGKLTITAGNTMATIRVPIIDDERYDHITEHLTLTLTNPVNAVLKETSEIETIEVKSDEEETPPTSISAKAGIQDNDPKPKISVSDASIMEPEEGNDDIDLAFTLTIDRLSDRNSRIRVKTMDETAAAGLDYEQLTGTDGGDPVDYKTEIIKPGNTEQTVKVKIKADALDEADETFKVMLFDPNSHVESGDGEGTGTIQDANDPPLLYPATSPFIGFEGSSDELNMEFLLLPDVDDLSTLDDDVHSNGIPSAKTISFDYEVLDGNTANPSATVNRDFRPTSGTAVIQPGEQGFTLNIPIVDDHTHEPVREEFRLVIKNLENAGTTERRHRGTHWADTGQRTNPAPENQGRGTHRGRGQHGLHSEPDPAQPVHHGLPVLHHRSDRILQRRLHASHRRVRHRIHLPAGGHPRDHRDSHPGRHRGRARRNLPAGSHHQGLGQAERRNRRAGHRDHPGRRPARNR